MKINYSQKSYDGTTELMECCVKQFLREHEKLENFVWCCSAVIE